MARKILIIDGHPDPNRARFCHALAQAYAEGARDSGHETRFIQLADAEIQLLRTAEDFARAPDSSFILTAREDLLWANHIVLVFPLWLGSAPAFVRAFLEQTARGEFFADMSANGWRPRLKGKSARMIVTMGMPALAYRLAFAALGVRSLNRSVLGFAGAAPVRATLFGMIANMREADARERLRKVRVLGRQGA